MIYGSEDEDVVKIQPPTTKQNQRSQRGGTSTPLAVTRWKSRDKRTINFISLYFFLLRDIPETLAGNLFQICIDSDKNPFDMR